MKAIKVWLFLHILISLSPCEWLCSAQGGDGTTDCSSDSCHDNPVELLTAPPLGQQSGCCQRIIPPIKLLKTGEDVVQIHDTDQGPVWANASCAAGRPSTNCVTPPLPYTLYTNAYLDEDFMHGIPILTGDGVQQESILVARRMVISLLNHTSRVLPNVSRTMSEAYIRLVITGCAMNTRDNFVWTSHPEAVVDGAAHSLGGASRAFPTAGASENALPVQELVTGMCYYGRYPDVLEEIFHTIHAIVIKEQDPDAFDAIVCLSARDTAMGVFATANTAAMIPSTEQARIDAVHMAFSMDWKDTVSYEYFIAAVAVWVGLPIRTLIHLPGNVSRASLKEHKPDLACLVARYFPDVGEHGGSACPSDIPEPTGPNCQEYPGSCHCLGSLTANYMGAALDRSKCPTLRSIKENSGYRNRTLPHNAASVNCSGCRQAGCDKDTGERGAEMLSSPSSAAVVTCQAALLLISLFALGF